MSSVLGWFTIQVHLVFNWLIIFSRSVTVRAMHFSWFSILPFFYDELQCTQWGKESSSPQSMGTEEPRNKPRQRTQPWECPTIWGTIQGKDLKNGSVMMPPFFSKQDSEIFGQFACIIHGRVTCVIMAKLALSLLKPCFHQAVQFTCFCFSIVKSCELYS